MQRLDEVRVHCPYCGAGFIALIEDEYSQSYVEDCRSCCSPIEFVVQQTVDGLHIETRRGDE
ncbi:MAG: CPXCG motif-containing cysteine-rich protein [Pseudomonadota bacterium]